MPNIINDINNIINESSEIASGMSRRKWGYGLGGTTLGIGIDLANKFFFDLPAIGGGLGMIGGYMTGQIQAYNYLREKVFGNKIEDVKRIDELIQELFSSVQRFGNKEWMSSAAKIPSCAIGAEDMQDDEIIKKYKNCYTGVIQKAIGMLKKHSRNIDLDKLKEVETLLKGLK